MKRRRQGDNLSCEKSFCILYGNGSKIPGQVLHLAQNCWLNQQKRWRADWRNAGTLPVQSDKTSKNKLKFRLKNHAFFWKSSLFCCIWLKDVVDYITPFCAGGTTDGLL